MSASPELCVKTTCAYCGVGCGVRATVTDQETRQVTIVGDDEHPANYGRLCSKGSALGETIGLEDRLLQPKVDGLDAGWDQALDAVAERLQSTIEQYGPDSVALYGSGQLLTEDYYVANKLMKGFVGSANIDTNSRLCMASTVAGHKRAFGEDIVPGCYEDLEQADLIVLVGSNTAWCHPVAYQRIQAANRAKLVVIDPRVTSTCEGAELHLPIKPGTDTILFAGLLVWLHQQQHLDDEWVAAHTEGFDIALERALLLAPSIKAISEACGLDSQAVETFFNLFANVDRTVTAWSQGANQGFDGTDRVNGIINVHLATGRIGKPGCGPFSLTGQPNAMGGREVGGLANQLAAHMDFGSQQDIDRVARFWQAPNMAQKPGLTAVDLFKAVKEKQVRFLWIMGTNPVVSMPEADQVREALELCGHVVVSDCVQNSDTAAYADILLPAAPWSEKDGTVTNSERRLSRQRAFLPLAGKAKPDWWILSRVAQKMGHKEAFDYQGSVDVFREHAALSGFENSRNAETGHSFRLFNISALKSIGVSDYDRLLPCTWPLTQPLAQPVSSGKRQFSEGGFSTPDGRARFVVPETKPEIRTNSDFPLVLNTGRIRDQWHTMTRTARATRLNRHIDEPFVQIHPQDAERFSVQDGHLARLRSVSGAAIARVQVDDGMTSGQVFMPMHWTREYSRGGLLGALVHSVTDPVSRQPDSKATPVAVSAYQAQWYGLFISRKAVELPDVDYCAAVRAEGCWRYEVGHSGSQELFEKLFPKGEQVTLSDGVGVLRQAILNEGRLETVFLTSQQPLKADRQWLQQLFAEEQESFDWRVLAGVSGSGEAQGALICSCFGVSEGQIQGCLSKGKASNVEELGSVLKAGTNCGSCIPELKKQVALYKDALDQEGNSQLSDEPELVCAG